VLCLVAVAAVSAGFVKTWSSPGPDYLQFWTIGRAMPVSSYYTLHGKDVPLPRAPNPALGRALAAGSDELHLTGTPLYYSCFAILSGADFLRSLHLFQVASLAAFLCGLVFMLRAWGYSVEGVSRLVAACFLFCVPLYNDTAQGNVSRLYVGLMAALLWTFRRRLFLIRTAASRGLLAVLILFKPFLAFAFLALLLQRIAKRRWRDIAYESAGFAGGLLFGFLLPSLLIKVPLGLWADFLRIQLHYVQDGDYSNRRLGDASVVEALTSFLHVSIIQLAGIVTLMILVAIMVVAPLIMARARAESTDLRADVEAADLAVLLSAAGFLVLSPLAWPHYYLLSLVLALFLMRPAPGALARPRIQLAGGVVGLLLLAGFPLAQRSELRWLGNHPMLSSLLDERFAVANVLVGCLGMLAFARYLRSTPPAPRRRAVRANGLDVVAAAVRIGIRTTSRANRVRHGTTSGKASR
jgi:hypothetical protein